MTPSPLPLRILIVDDNEVNRDILEGFLSRLRCESVLVESGLAALEALKNSPVDLIFMDCQMPHMNGYEATRAIRLEHQATRIPIIGVTASDTSDVAEACRAAGMDDVVGKPITLPVLQTLLDRWIRPVDPRVLQTIHEELDESTSFENSHKVVEAYLLDAPTHVQALKDAVQHADGEGIRREAHILKGTSSYFGTYRLVNLCVTLERLSKTEGSTDLAPYASAIEEEFNHVRQILENRYPPPAA